MLESGEFPDTVGYKILGYPEVHIGLLVEKTVIQLVSGLDVAC